MRIRAAMAALAFAAAVAGVACGDGGESAGDTTTTTEAPTTIEATTTTVDDTVGLPKEVVAVDAAGRLIVLSPVDGAVQRVLLEGIDATDPAKLGVTITPDHTTVYLGRPSGPGGAGEIVAVPVAGGAPQTVASGLIPAVSPDGRQLAFVRVEDAVPSLVLRNLSSGSERRFAPGGATSTFQFIPDVAWSSDGRHVVFIAGEIRTGLYALPLSGTTSLADAVRLGPEAQGRGEDVSWTGVTNVGDRLAVIERRGSVPAEQRIVLAVTIDPPKAEGGLLSEDISPVRIDSVTGAPGMQLLYVQGGGPQGGPLFRVTPGHEPVRLFDTAVVAAW